MPARFFRYSQHYKTVARNILITDTKRHKSDSNVAKLNQECLEKAKKTFNTPRPPHEPPDDYNPKCCYFEEFEVPEGVSCKVFRPLSCPKEQLGPKASKSGRYKNPEYFAYHRFSFYEAQHQAIHLRDERLKMEVPICASGAEEGGRAREPLLAEDPIEKAPRRLRARESAVQRVRKQNDFEKHRFVWPSLFHVDSEDEICSDPLARLSEKPKSSSGEELVAVWKSPYMVECVKVGSEEAAESKDQLAEKATSEIEIEVFVEEEEPENMETFPSLFNVVEDVDKTDATDPARGYPLKFKCSAVEKPDLSRAELAEAASVPCKDEPAETKTSMKELATGTGKIALKDTENKDEKGTNSCPLTASTKESCSAKPEPLSPCRPKDSDEDSKCD